MKYNICFIIIKNIQKKEGEKNVKERINMLFGSVDKMLEKTGNFISRAYLYKLINGEKTNITLQIALELKEVLELDTLEELVILLDSN